MRAVPLDALEEPEALAPGADRRVAAWARARWSPRAPIGFGFPCPFVGHEGTARLSQRPGGADWVMACGCGGTDEWVSLGRLVAAEQWAGGPVRRGAPFRVSPFAAWLWTLRVQHEAGVVPVPLPTVPDLGPDATEPERRVVAGLALLTALVTTHDDAPDPTGCEPFSARFAAAWCGLSKSTAHRALLALVRRGVLTAGEPRAPSVGRNRPTATYGLPLPAPARIAGYRASEQAVRFDAALRPFVVPRPLEAGDTVHRRPNRDAPRGPEQARRGSRRGLVPVADLDRPVCDVEGHQRTPAWRLPGGPWMCGRCEPPPTLEWGAYAEPTADFPSVTPDAGAALDAGRPEAPAVEGAPRAPSAPNEALARRAAQLWRPAAVSGEARRVLARTVPAFMAATDSRWPDVAALIAEAARPSERHERDLLAIFDGSGAPA